jgi:adenylate cyclase
VSEGAVQRRLAAILAADVVGYSRLMGADEAGTLAALKALRAGLIDSKVAEHSGRIFKATGDGVLVEFPSVVNAVACAVDIQRGMQRRNADLPAERAIQLRIAVNLGDVIVDGDDIFGDGVNVAARLEAIAPPGGIAISAVVRDQIGSRLDLQFADMGEQVLKNIAQPVRVFGVFLGDTARRAPAPASSGVAKPSIAILPFTNMSGDPEQEYFSDGITEDIITELSRYHSLAVVARNSSFQFRGPGANLAAVRRALGVHYIVEGSIRKAGTRVRITAQLIDAATGKHLWAERYDRTIEDVFAVQDEVVQTIVSTLEGRLAASGAAQGRGKPTDNWVAYDYFLRGRELSSHYRVGEADDCLARAIDLDPGYVHAHAWRASTLVAKYWYDRKPETLQQAVACAETALSLDDSDAWCHQAMGFVSLHSKKLAVAGMHFERAMSLNPNDVNIIADYANWLCYMGRFDEALRYLDLAMQRDPFPPSWMWEVRGTVLLQSKRYEEAISVFHKAPIENFFTRALLAATYAWAGQIENASRELALAREGKPDLTVSYFALFPYADEAHRKHLQDGLRKAGLPE